MIAGLTTPGRSYRRYLDGARARLEAVDRRVTHTDFGTVEYAERGTGEAVLISHGIFHGCDGGLLSARDLVSGRRVIAPSRFGYLGSTLPPGASGAAQADAFVALLDHLRVADVDAVGISAGTGAVVQLALRHPDRVRHLVISSGNWPGSDTAKAPPGWAKLFYSDRAMWALKTVAPPMLSRLMGIPKGFPTDANQARVVAEMLDSIFPIEPRAEGAVFDAYISNPEINDYPLEAITVPTLMIHAKDDPLASYDAASRVAKRIPDAVFLALDRGGHLALGQTDLVGAEINSFLRASPERC